MAGSIQGTGGNQPIDPSSIHIATPMPKEPLEALSMHYHIQSGVEVLQTLKNQVEQLKAARGI